MDATSERSEEPRQVVLREVLRTINANPKIKVDLLKTEYPIIRSVATCCFQYRMWCRNEPKEEASLIWSDTYVPDETVKKLRCYQRINHFPGSEELGRKDRLAVNLMHCRGRMPHDYDFFPQTWLLPRDLDDFRKSRPQSDSSVYIAKPEASSQGRGIFLFRTIDTFKSDEPLVVQQYINRPLTLQRLKFDFRIYVLLKSISPLRIFMYREGLSRFATHQYEEAKQGNLNDLTMHLTNYAINKRNPSFIFNRTEDEDNVGHKRSYTAIIHALKELGKDTQQLERQIEEIIVKTILSAEEKLLNCYRACRPLEENVCFELLGFDVMLDEQMKPYLIEVNHSPSFSTDAPIDLNVKKHLIMDTLNLLNLSYDDKKNFQIHKDPNNSKPSKLFSHANGVSLAQYESIHAGGFKRIFPSESSQLNKYYEEIREQISLRRTKKKRARISLPQTSNTQSKMARRKSQEKGMNIIFTTQETCEDSPLKMYGMSESAVIRDNRTENSHRGSNLIGEREKSADSKISDRHVRLTNIRFETMPFRENSRASSHLRLFRQFQLQNNMLKAVSKTNLQPESTRPSRETINCNEEEDLFYRRKCKKVSLFNFEQSLLIQRRLQLESKRVMQCFMAELDFSGTSGRFNPVRNWREAPKMRFHRIRNLQHHTHPTAGGFHSRPVSEDDKHLNRNG